MRLNLGCGNFPVPGWTNVDLPDAVADPHFTVPEGIELVAASVLDLPFEDDTAVAVYAGHVLEHISLDDMPRALAEIRRVMTDGAELMVVGPDIERARSLGFDEEVQKDIIGRGARWPGDGHAWLPTGAQHHQLLLDAGFAVEQFDVMSVPSEWPVVSRISWQFALRAS